jgi:hypothetical protein
MANNTKFRADLVSCLRIAQTKKNRPLIECWFRSLKAYDAQDVDGLNFWLKHGGYLLPEMRDKALHMKPITLDGLKSYEKEQVGEKSSLSSR